MKTSTGDLIADGVGFIFFLCVCYMMLLVWGV